MSPYIGLNQPQAVVDPNSITGRIVESGSDANGSWEKWDTGLMICRLTTSSVWKLEIK